MPGLSSSTLNLKFMQRANARTPTSGPSTPGPSNAKTDHQTPTPGTATPQAIGSDEAPLLASEEPYRWTVKRPSAVPRPAENTSGVKFETSYLPFIEQSAGSDSEGAGPGPSSMAQGGGGRMVFGYKEPEQEDLEKSDDEMNGEGSDGEDGDVVINVKKEKEKGKRENARQGRAPIMSGKGFMRPKDRSISPDLRKEKSLLPTNTKGHSDKKNQSRDSGKNGPRDFTRVKEEPSSQLSTTPAKSSASSSHISTSAPAVAIGNGNANGKNRKRKPSQSSSTETARAKFNINSSQGSVSDKKPRLSPSILNDHPSQPSQSVPVQGSQSIDEREAALKAQRKKEKNVKKKARKSAEKA